MVYPPTVFYIRIQTLRSCCLKNGRVFWNLVRSIQAIIRIFWNAQIDIGFFREYNIPDIHSNPPQTKMNWKLQKKYRSFFLAFNDRIKILWGFSFNPFLKPRSWGNENSMLRWITNPPKVILSIVNRISQIYLCEWYRHSINSPIQVT